ncbi:hypothetical protein FJZ31_41455 [Candidatus Poribacteria bacterium]|nr:hypothetical protein [Candidatus Poribacteria bacterium]
MISNSVTLRAIIIGLILIIPNSYFSVQTYTPTSMSLVYTVIFNLIILIILNLPLKKFLPKWALSQGELLTIYVMLSLSTVISGLDMIQVLGQLLGHAFWFATPENEWQELFFRYIPKWLAVDDKNILEGYYKGDSSFFTTENIKVWLVPILSWSAFLLMLMFIMLMINVIIRKQWTEREKLSYPIIQLPFIMTEDGGYSRLFTNRLLWMGFAVAGGIDLINGLHYLIPAIPMLPIRNIEIGRYFTNKPFSAIGWTPVCFFPFAVGLTFFMPLSLSFSCWFFYLFWKVQLVFASIVGLENLAGFPYAYYKPQASGGYIGVGLLAIFSLRRHIAAVIKKVFTGKGTLNDEMEPMRYRWAVLGLIIGAGLLIAFCLKAGMSLWIILLFFAIYFTLSIAITRMRAELGPPVNELYHIGPDLIIPQVFGTRRVGESNLTMFAFFWGFNRSNRCHPMPHQLEGFKLAEQIKMNYKRLFYAMLLATFIGTLAAFFFYYDVNYKYGNSGWAGFEAFRRLQQFLYYHPGRENSAVVLMGVGFAVVFILTILRTRFIWWPLHPVAYPLASSLNWTMSWIWACIFISWAAKFLILKYGGLKAYRKAIPFFIGLVLGDYMVGGFWNIIGVVFHKYTYTFWH